MTNVCLPFFCKLIRPRGERAGGGHKLFPARRCFRHTAKAVHEPFVTVQLDSALGVNGAHEWPPTDPLSLGAIRLRWRPLPNPQHPREMTHVGLSQHELKLVLQHYPVCVNMGKGVWYIF